MSFLRQSLFIFFVTLLSVLSANVFAQQTVVERQVIVSAPPATTDTVVIPYQEAAKCVTKEAGWYGNVWVPKHTECEYTNVSEGSQWIEGYWGCTESTMGSKGEVCTTWKWNPGRWVKTVQKTVEVR